MLRCSRLINSAMETDIEWYKKKNETKGGYEDEYITALQIERKTHLQPGDKQSGWEIIASLPLEEQTDISIYDKLKAMGITCLMALYEWDGTNWNEVKE